MNQGICCKNCGGELRVSYLRRHANSVRRRHRCVECGEFCTSIQRIVASDSINRLSLREIVSNTVDASGPIHTNNEN